MWWKLGFLTVAMATMIFADIPMRTHAVPFDPMNPPPRPKLCGMASSMYLTSGAVILIVLILAVAAAIGFWIVRSA